MTGERAGPIALLQAGIHGDEVAGVIALDLLERVLSVQNGTVLIVPRLNAPAVAQRKRYLNFDLNRAFADEKRRSPYEFALAKDISTFVATHGVEYLITLHEASTLRKGPDGSGLGQSVCYGVLPEPQLLQQWLALVNRHIVSKRERFNSIYYPIPTSSTEVLVRKYSLRGGYCVETWNGFDLRRRVEMQFLVATKFLESLGIRYSLSAPCAYIREKYEHELPEFEWVDATGHANHC